MVLTLEPELESVVVVVTWLVLAGVGVVLVVVVVFAVEVGVLKGMGPMGGGLVVSTATGRGRLARIMAVRGVRSGGGRYSLSQVRRRACVSRTVEACGGGGAELGAA